MRLFFTTTLLFLATQFIQAQIGITSNVNFHGVRTNENTSQSGFDPYEELDTGWEIAVNYWFRLPGKRVEFMPTLYYGFTRFDENFTSGLNEGLHEAGFQFKTNIYPFDFGGDCDCPTFGKQGPQLQKGFFLQLSPGFTYYRTENVFVQEAEAQEHTGFTLGAGIGLDIGLSNFLTLTPLVAVRRGFGVYSKVNVSDMVGTLYYDEDKLTTFQAGLQLSFRFDHKKY